MKLWSKALCFVAIAALLLSSIAIYAYTAEILALNVQSALGANSTCAKAGTNLDFDCAFSYGISTSAASFAVVFFAVLIMTFLSVLSMFLTHKFLRHMASNLKNIAASLIAIPAIAWFPLIFFIIGFVESPMLNSSSIFSELIFVILGAFPFMLYESLKGVSNCDAAKLNVIERGNKPSWESFKLVLLPACKDNLFQGAKVSATVAFILSAVYGSFIQQRNNIGRILDPLNENTGHIPGLIDAMIILLIAFFAGCLIVAAVALVSSFLEYILRRRANNSYREN